MSFLLLLLPLSIQGHQLGHVVADPGLQDHAVLVGLPEEPEEPGGSEPGWQVLSSPVKELTGSAL